MIFDEQRLPLKRWIINWTLSFLTQAIAAPQVSADILGLQVLHLLSFASVPITKVPMYAAITATGLKLISSTIQSLAHADRPLRILVGLGLATMGQSEMNPMFQHYFAMLFFWTFCDSNLYRPTDVK